MKKLVAFVVVLVTIFTVGIFVLAFVSSYVEQSVKDCDPEVLAELGVELGDLTPGGATGVSLENTSEYVIPGVDLPEENIKRAIRIAEIVRKQGLPYKAAEIALITSRTEASYMNPTPAQSDRDSAGPFQQRPPWGSLRERMKYRKSTLLFLYGGSTVPDGYQEPGLTDIPGWQTRPSGEVAQAVQISAYPDRYADHIAEARLILRHIGWTPSVSEIIQTAGTTIPMEEIAHCMPGDEDILDLIVKEALSHEGEAYTWGEEFNGADFAKAMFDAYGITIPSDLADQLEFEGDDEAGIRAKLLSADAIGSLQRGDLVFSCRAPPCDVADVSKPADVVGIYAGNLLGELKVATYNVWGSNHTPATGPKSGPNRVVKAAQLISTQGFAVVGLQELQRNQRPALMNELGRDKYGIWPERPVYRDSTKNDKANSQNSIVWDKSQVKLIRDGSGSWPMPFYFQGPKKPRDIPLFHGEHISTGQEFWVANTHDPAKNKHKKLRVRNAKRHVQDAWNLIDRTGQPVFFTGDFNSGYSVILDDDRGNHTKGDKRQNLAYCIMTESRDGLTKMLNGYDAARSRTGQCPVQTSKELGVGYIDHVYVSSDVNIVEYGAIDKSKTASDHPVIYVTADFSPTGVQASQPGEYGYMVVPRRSDGDIAIQRVRKSEFVAALRFTIVDTASVDTVGDWALPMAKPFRLTNKFGQAESYYSSGKHTGLDFAPDPGNDGTIFAVTTGKIVRRSYDAGGYGNYVVQELSDGTLVYYCHLASFGVEADDGVVAGSVIGKAGETGNAFGVHLHIEIRPKGGSPVDPLPVLRKHGLDL